VRSFFFAVALVAKVAMAKVAVLCNVTCQEYIVTLQLYCKVPNFTVFLHPYFLPTCRYPVPCRPSFRPIASVAEILYQKVGLKIIS
jgi:hypothetical protein